MPEDSEAPLTPGAQSLRADSQQLPEPWNPDYLLLGLLHLLADDPAVPP